MSAPPLIGSRGGFRKMHAGIESVGRHHQLAIRRHLQQSGVVADAQHNVAAPANAGADA